jgi:group I intron endonuclease
MAAGIYRIGHNDSDRGYIGQTIDFDVRFGLHWGQLRRDVHHNKPLQHAYNKYGRDAFTITVMEECDIAELNDDAAKALLWEREIVWWEKEPNPYNTAPPGPSMLGYKHTDEARANMSAAFMGRNKGVKQSPELIAKRAAATRGHKVSDETRKKQSEAAKGRPGPGKGVPRTPEVKAKISEANMGHGFTDETRSKISESLLQYHQDVRDGKVIPNQRKPGPSRKGVPRPQHVIDAMQAGRRQKREERLAAEAKSLEGMSGTDSHPDEEA